MRRVLILTKNEYLKSKIALALSEEGVALICREGEEWDVCFLDLDTMPDAPRGDGVITMSRTLPCTLKIPAAFEDIVRLAKVGVNAALSLEGRICTIRGERIRLTELEAALLSRLIAAGGEFVSRERLLSDVWGDGDGGIVNVYIHYLREKIERGEKIILSSRKLGYKIDARYIMEGEHA